MPLVNRKRPRIGDVIEIETPGGLAYVQYTYNDKEPPVWGALIRVLPGLFQSRPHDFSDLVREHARFFVFFPLGAACHRGLVKVVAHEEIPEDARGLHPKRLNEIWNDTMLAERMASEWRAPDAAVQTPVTPRDAI